MVPTAGAAASAAAAPKTSPENNRGGRRKKTKRTVRARPFSVLLLDAILGFVAWWAFRPQGAARKRSGREVNFWFASGVLFGTPSGKKRDPKQKNGGPKKGGRKRVRKKNENRDHKSSTKSRRQNGGDFGRGPESGPKMWPVFNTARGSGHFQRREKDCKPHLIWDRKTNRKKGANTKPPKGPQKARKRRRATKTRTRQIRPKAHQTDKRNNGCAKSGPQKGSEFESGLRNGTGNQAPKTGRRQVCTVRCVFLRRPSLLFCEPVFGAAAAGAAAAAVDAAATTSAAAVAAVATIPLASHLAARRFSDADKRCALVLLWPRLPVRGTRFLVGRSPSPSHSNSRLSRKSFLLSKPQQGLPTV